MKIVVAGTRGIPNIMGGVETHCEELYPILAEMGCDITVIRRAFYVSPDNKKTSYKNVHLKDIYAPHLKSLEAIVHTFSSIWYAKKVKADILHIHAIGPCLMVPLARLLGLKVVMTHHGFDYDRQKWGGLARFALRLGERFGVKYANEVIVISKFINELISQKYKRTNAHLIYNGVNIPKPTTDTQYINSLGLEKGNYVFAMGRFVGEKRFDRLIEVFDAIEKGNTKLVIAGDANHADKYVQNLKKMALEKGVILPGFVKGEKLNELLSHARVFILPSTHEGLPISLLEAMSYGLDVLASDIPANKAVNLPKDCYFKVEDKKSFADALTRKINHPTFGIQYDLTAYNWEGIAKQTKKVYEKTLTNE